MKQFKRFIKLLWKETKYGVGGVICGAILSYLHYKYPFSSPAYLSDDYRIFASIVIGSITGCGVSVAFGGGHHIAKYLHGVWQK